MFWDRVAWVYDIFANGINRKANRALCASVKKMILPTDNVLECACGTGLLTAVIAPSCKQLTATVFSEKMLKRAKKKCKKFGNVQFAQTDILHLPYPDACFDAVVAANVIHLLDHPYQALNELDRVCRAGGRIIVPTYMNRTDTGTRSAKRAQTSSTNSHSTHIKRFSPTSDMPTQAIPCARAESPAQWRYCIKSNAHQRFTANTIDHRAANRWCSFMVSFRMLFTKPICLCQPFCPSSVDITIQRNRS